MSRQIITGVISGHLTDIVGVDPTLYFTKTQQFFCKRVAILCIMCTCMLTIDIPAAGFVRFHWSTVGYLFLNVQRKVAVCQHRKGRKRPASWQTRMLTMHNLEYSKNNKICICFIGEEGNAFNML